VTGGLRRDSLIPASYAVCEGCGSRIVMNHVRQRVRYHAECRADARHFQRARDRAALRQGRGPFRVQ
jgi:DNA-directed RNA polymerase subunit RPC12/RpoP